MSDLWHFIDSVYSRYADDHRGKTDHMRLREKKLVSVKFRDVESESDAVCFKIINSNPSTLGSATLHNVVIGKKPGESFFRMWCGDTKIAKEDGEKEDRCNFWQNHNKNGESISYACKHMVHVLDNIGERGRREVEQMLSPFSQPSFPHDNLGFIMDLWEPAFIYGPTGSGKSHEVRRMVKKYTEANPDVHVSKIRITDALEDVDALQKILPATNEDGSGTLKRIVGEMRKVFDIARNQKSILILEELTRSSRPFRNLLIHALDQNDGDYELHDITTGETIQVPVENLLYIATANLAYSDTSALDPALARRFTFNIFYDYDTGKEAKLLRERVDKKTADKMQRITKTVRDQYRNGILPCPLDTGSLIKWADIVKKGLDLKDAAFKTWVFRVVDKDSLGYPEQGQLDGIVKLF